MILIRELRQRRSKAIADARALVEAADAAKRELTTEENERFTTFMADADKLKADIERRELLETEEREMNDSAGRRAGGRENPEEGGGEGPPQTGVGSAAYRAAFNSYLVSGLQGMRNEELRALQADTNSAGGYLYTPLELINGLLKAMDNMVFVRRLATKYQVNNSESLGIPTLATDVSDAAWTTELLTGSEDSDMAFGRRDFKPNPLAKRIKISNKLLRKVPNADQLVMDRLAYKFGVAQENAFLTGSGTGQPLGLFTASANGIPVGRDVSTGNTSTAITFDGLLAAKYSIKAGYQANAQWGFHRNAIEQIAKIKDTTGQYIWKESMRAGEPDLLLGRPINASEYIPNTFTTGLYVGIYGDFSYYWIADSIAMEMQRLVELYAETNQVGLIGRLETDGAPVMGEAFARVKLA